MDRGLRSTHCALGDMLNLQKDIAQKVATTIGQPHGAVFRTEGRRPRAGSAGRSGSLLMYAGILFVSGGAQTREARRNQGMPGTCGCALFPAMQRPGHFYL